VLDPGTAPPALATPAAQLQIEPAELILWSPSTGDLALGGNENVLLIPLDAPVDLPLNVDAAQAQSIAAEAPALLAGAQSTPRLAWADAANRIYTYDATTGAAPTAVAQEDAAVTGLALAPQGDRLAYTTSDGSLAVISPLDQPGGGSRQEFTPPGWLSNLSFSPDGRMIAGTDAPNFMAYILDAQTGAVVRTLDWFDSPTPNLYGVFFSPDWSRAAWVAQTAVQVMTVSDGSKGPLLNHEDHVTAAAWSPDGARLATASVATIDGAQMPAVLIWDPATGDQLKVLPQPGAIRGLAFSPDSSQIAVIGVTQTLQIWNLEP
jgi:WD40 repeat protein